MANPYSKYTGARVQPLPSGFIEAYGRVGESYRKGIVGLAEGIQRYYQNKEERAIATGEVEALVAAASQNPELYPGLINEETQKKLEGMDNMSKSQLLRFNNFLKGQVSQLDKARKAEQEKALMQLQRDKLEAEKKKNLADAEAAKAAGEKAKAERADDAANLLALQTRYGAIQKTDHLGHYLPDRNVSVPMDSPAAQPSMLRPFEAPAELISDTYYPGVREGKLPDEAAAKALAGAGTFAGAKDIAESLEEDSTTDTRSTAEKNLEALRKTSQWLNATPEERRLMESRIFDVEDPAAPDHRSAKEKDWERFQQGEAWKNANPQQRIAMEKKFFGVDEDTPTVPASIQEIEWILANADKLENNPGLKRKLGMAPSAFKEKMDYIKDNMPAGMNMDMVVEAAAGFGPLANKKLLLQQALDNRPEGYTADDVKRVVLMGGKISTATDVEEYLKARTKFSGDPKALAAVDKKYGVPTEAELEEQKVITEFRRQQLTDLQNKAKEPDFLDMVKSGEMIHEIPGVGTYVMTSTNSGYLKTPAAASGASGGGTSSALYGRYLDFQEKYMALEKGGIPEVLGVQFSGTKFKFDPEKLTQIDKNRLTMMGHVLATMEHQMGVPNKTQYLDYTDAKWVADPNAPAGGKWVHKSTEGKLPAIKFTPPPTSPAPLNVPPLPGGGEGAAPQFQRPNNLNHLVPRPE